MQGDARLRTYGKANARLARGDLAAITVASHRKILNHVWRPHLDDLPFLGVRYSMLLKIADAYTRNKLE